MSHGLLKFTVGDRAWILRRTREGLAAIDPALGPFAEMMLERALLDVETRPGKAVGAYCTSFPTRRLPFVSANFNGSRSDVRTLMHELVPELPATNAIVMQNVQRQYEEATFGPLEPGGIV
jgi:hypothetical protein